MCVFELSESFRRTGSEKTNYSHTRSAVNFFLLRSISLLALPSNPFKHQVSEVYRFEIANRKLYGNFFPSPNMCFDPSSQKVFTPMHSLASRVALEVIGEINLQSFPGDSAVSIEKSLRMHLT